EFAIVILNALCAASEPVCHVVTDETSLLDHLVSFLEAADANMTQIAQHQGIHALRENPEIIGTSVGMLRRSTLIMTHIVRHEQCRQHFQRLQHRLLQFTVSHFVRFFILLGVGNTKFLRMDSRVAAMVSDILYEMQKGENGGGTGVDPNNEELVTLTTNKRAEKNIGDEQQEQQKSSPKLLNGDESINEGGGNSNNSSNNNNNNCGVGGYGHQMDFSKQKMEFQSSTRHFSLNSSDELTSALTLAAPSSIYSTSYSSIPHPHHSTSTTALRALYNGGTENCYSNKNTSETPTENKGLKIIPSTQQNGCDPWMYKNENNIINNSTTTTNNETPIPKKRGRKRPTATTTNTSETSSPKKSWSQKRQTNKKVSENPAMDNSSTDNNTSVNSSF
uniref:SWI/SNF-like complex subunit BAF250 C-terminal domain-containing protein n=1 Tax=Meloidogyne floridensis TaxID=298350 RepID=A0A915NEA8_9BILA